MLIKIPLFLFFFENFLPVFLLLPTVFLVKLRKRTASTFWFPTGKQIVIWSLKKCYICRKIQSYSCLQCYLLVKTHKFYIWITTQSLFYSSLTKFAKVQWLILMKTAHLSSQLKKNVNFFSKVGKRELEIPLTSAHLPSNWRLTQYKHYWIGIYDMMSRLCYLVNWTYDGSPNWDVIIKNNIYCYWSKVLIK